MRETKLIRHGHKIASRYDDLEGTQSHDIYFPSEDSPLFPLAKAGKDQGVTDMIREHGDSSAWEFIWSATTQAQAFKIAKTRMMLMELSDPERQEINKAAVEPLVPKESDGEE